MCYPGTTISRREILYLQHIQLDYLSLPLPQDVSVTSRILLNVLGIQGHPDIFEIIWQANE